MDKKKQYQQLKLRIVLTLLFFLDSWYSAENHTSFACYSDFGLVGICISNFKAAVFKK